MKNLTINSLVSIVLCILAFAASDFLCMAQVTPSGTTKCNTQKGCKIIVPTSSNLSKQEIQKLLKITPQQKIEDALELKQKFKADYQAQILRNVVPKNKQNQPIKKGRLLQSSDNQYAQIQEGSNIQATMYDYVFSIRGNNFTIFSVSDPKLTLVYSQNFASNIFPKGIHASNGYFCIILQDNNSPYNTTIKVYWLQNSQLKLVRVYTKQGSYVGSRQYDSHVIVLTQQQMQPSAFIYSWNISDQGVINDTIFQGSSSNLSSSYLGSAARSIAKIPLGPATNTNYKFATYLFCDFTWDLLLTPYLNIFIPANYYGTPNFSTSFQTFSFNQQSGQQWGTSRWAILPGLVYHILQLHQYNGYFRVVTLRANGGLYSEGSVSVAKIPMLSFDPAQGSIQHNLGVYGVLLFSSRWKYDLAFIMFQDGTIKTYSTQLNKLTDVRKNSQKIFLLFPYINNYMIGVGTSYNYSNIAIGLFDISNRKPNLIKILNLNGSYSSTYLGWFSVKYFQLDWIAKRITFPIFSQQNQPYKNGYYQVYANPYQNCMSSLPVPKPCPANLNVSASVVGKVVKHWDNTANYDFNTGLSEYIEVSATLHIFSKHILITGSQCQLQSKVIVDPYQPLTNHTNQVWYEDLCP